MGDKELLGGNSSGITADQVPPGVITSFGMTITGGDQTMRPVTPPAAPTEKALFGTHIGEAVRVLKGGSKPRA